MLILNFSVDSKDVVYADSYPLGMLRNADQMGEDLSVNDIESLVELVLETGLDLEDAVPEHDESDEDNKLRHLADFYCVLPAVIRFAVPALLSVSASAVYQKSCPTQAFEIHSPPPEVLAPLFS